MLSLTSENYYSREANEAYWSASFLKAMLSCPARAMAELRGEYERPFSTAMLVGSYIDAYFSSPAEFKQFCTEHTEEIFTAGYNLRAEFQRADRMIRCVEADDIFMQYLEGEKQVIKTGTLEGIPFKCRMDVLKPGERIVDLKTTKNMEPMVKGAQGRVTFAEYWEWPLQMAVYQHLEGNGLPCYLAVVTKEEPPDIAIIEIPQHVLDAEMEVLRERVPYFDAIRQGVLEPERCGKCAYCRSTKRLSGPISLDDFMDI